MKTNLWTVIKWPFNSDKPFSEWECPCRKLAGGRFILYPSQFQAGEWSYVANFGADSERSHSGGFPDGFTLNQAKAEIEKKITGGRYNR